MALQLQARSSLAAGFSHRALLYAGEAEYVRATSEFIAAGQARAEPTLVAVSAAKVTLLQEACGDAGVQYVDMAELGHNPAHIIPAWQEFLGQHGGVDQAVRGIGEPIWAERSDPELVECQRHEALLNVVFSESSDFQLLCPYDTSSLSDVVIAEARDNHSQVQRGGAEVFAHDLDLQQLAAAHLCEPLPSLRGPVTSLEFGADDIHTVRDLAASVAAAGGMGHDRTYDLALAVSELATNSVVHGGGSGRFLIWLEASSVLCELRDRGRIEDPLAGRQLPPLDGFGKRGLWTVTQLCDLVQIRAYADGSLVRVHMHLH